MIKSSVVDGCPYRKIRPLGEGAVGDVHLCVDVFRRRLVVVKWLRAELAHHADSVARFRREAELMSRARFEGVIKVEDYGGDRFGSTWMSMEFVDGRTPGAVIGPGDAWATHRLLAGVARSLDELHGLGVVHRDLKPDNLLLRNGVFDGQIGWEPVVIDLGIAKWLAHDTATATGSVFGTPHYMSPEQFRDSKHVGPATDRYAMAVIAYELLCGALPYDGRSLPELLNQHLEMPIPELRVPIRTRGRRSPTMPGTSEPGLHTTPRLDRFMQVAMAKAPHARFASSEEMAAEFRHAAIADGVWDDGAGPAPAFEPLPAPIIEVTGPANHRRRFDMREGPVVVGRHEACQITLDSPRISRLHACVYTQRGRLWLADLASQNGSRANGRVLAPGRPAPVPLNGSSVSLQMYDLQIDLRAVHS